MRSQAAELFPARVARRLVLTVIALSSIALVFLTWAVASGAAWTEIDLTIVDYIHRHITPGLVQFMWSLSVAGNEFVTFAAVLLAVSFALRREWRNMALVLVAVGGAQLLVLILKLIFQRLRPVFTDPVQVLHSFSFPSGHATAAAVFYGLLLFLSFSITRSTFTRAMLLVAALLLCLGIGFSRVYLGVHYPTDVLAGFLFGTIWLLCSFLIVAALPAWSAARRSASSEGGTA